MSGRAPGQSVRLFHNLNFNPAFMSEAAQIVGGEAPTFLVNSSFGEGDARRCSDALFAIDAMIETRDLTNWDKEMLSRHASVLGTANPMAVPAQAFFARLQHGAATCLRRLVGEQVYAEIIEKLDDFRERRAP